MHILHFPVSRREYLTALSYMNQSGAMGAVQVSLDCNEGPIFLTTIPSGIQFTLRYIWTPINAALPPLSKEDLTEMVEYVPLNLDSESDEFNSALGPLNGQMIFERKKLRVFMHALATRIANFAADSFDNNQLIDRFVCNYHILLSSFRLMDGFHSMDFLDPR